MMFDQDTESQQDQTLSHVENTKIYCYFPQNFDDKNYEYIKCAIGLGLSNDPVVDNCGHIYCRGCIKTYLLTEQQCPQSRKPLRKEDLRTVLQLKQMIDNIQITCEKCTTKYSIKDQQKHQNQCEYFIKYPNQKEIVKDLLKIRAKNENLKIINENQKKAFINLWKDSKFYQSIEQYDSSEDFELSEQIFLYELDYIPSYDKISLKQFLKIFQKMNLILDFLEAQDIQNKIVYRQQGIKFQYEQSYFILFINELNNEIQFIWKKKKKNQDNSEEDYEEDYDDEDSQIINQQQEQCQKYTIQNTKNIEVTINENEIIFKQLQETQNFEFKFQTNFQKESKIYAIVSRKVNQSLISIKYYSYSL